MRTIAEDQSSRRDYHGEIDYFAVYCPETGGVYLVPIADLDNPPPGCSLRVADHRNGQSRQYPIGGDYDDRELRARP